MRKRKILVTFWSNFVHKLKNCNCNYFTWNVIQMGIGFPKEFTHRIIPTMWFWQISLSSVKKLLRSNQKNDTWCELPWIDVKLLMCSWNRNTNQTESNMCWESKHKFVPTNIYLPCFSTSIAFFHFHMPTFIYFKFSV